MIDRMNVFGSKRATHMDKPATLTKPRKRADSYLGNCNEPTYDWYYRGFYDVRCTNQGKSIYKRRPKRKTIFIDGNYLTLGSALYYLQNPIKAYNYMDALLTTKSFIGMDDMDGYTLIIQLPTEMTNRVLNFTMNCVKKFIKRNNIRVIMCGTRGQCNRLESLFDLS